jgi:hypothetical protein
LNPSISEKNGCGSSQMRTEKLKRIVADMSLDKALMQDLRTKSCGACAQREFVDSC